jgi:hypothetical protein
VSEVIGDTMENDIGNTARTAGCSKRGEAVAELDIRAHSEAPIFGGAVGMPKHDGCGVREGSPLSLHLCELVISVRGRKLGCVSRRGDHAAANNIKVVRITFGLDGGPECMSRV